ncbi:hypothetical protein PCYB_003160 [Plasmodium cynomolgi strain B]|uniref:Uncharacterized protein n=1 Tax=Plasmodium cynomolgi (strain B) TaxID=1120755 RepID=K6VJI7_PLACD|nr:hypothetical protein PCYB_003160 [Plasmodium cynomolgi strain B]GAB69567.1 hypothetical protein PCYB_003160 [Plasmodium cynomolgi strain B]
MVDVYFEVSTENGKLDKNGCIVLFLDIQDNIKNKINELEKIQGENQIHEKCQEIDKYLKEQNHSHNECYQDSIKIIVASTEQETNNLLSQSNVYSKYCKCLISKDEECTEPKVETEELGKEKGKYEPEQLPEEKSNQATSSCNAMNIQQTVQKLHQKPQKKQP